MGYFLLIADNPDQSYQQVGIKLFFHQVPFIGWINVGRWNQGFMVNHASRPQKCLVKQSIEVLADTLDSDIRNSFFSWQVTAFTERTRPGRRPRDGPHVGSVLPHCPSGPRR